MSAAGRLTVEAYGPQRAGEHWWLVSIDGVPFDSFWTETTDLGEALVEGRRMAAEEGIETTIECPRCEARAITWRCPNCGCDLSDLR